MIKTNNKFGFVVANLAAFLVTIVISALIAQSELNVELVKEIKFPAQSKLTIFDYTDPLSPIPNVRVYDKKIVFYNEKGELISAKEYDEQIAVDYSENKKYFQVGSVADGEYKIDFYDGFGNKLLSKRSSFSEDIPPAQFKISNAGALIELSSVNGNVIFYNRDGQEVKQINYFESSDTWDAISAIFSQSGDQVLVAINYPLMGGRQKNSEIILYDVRGNEKWRFEAKQKHVFSRVFLSPTANYAISSHYDRPKYEKNKESQITGPRNLTTYVINAITGNIIAELADIRVREVLFYQKNSADFALVNDVGDQITYLNLTDGSLQNTHQLSSNEEIIGMDVDMHTGMIVIAKSQLNYEKLAKRGYMLTLSQPQLEFFDLTGNFITEVNLNIPQLNERLNNNKIRFIEKGNKLLIDLPKARRLMIFSITKN